jgi:hypothetical protein
VQVLYGEDVASHTAPESCVVSREGQGEASTGDHAGWPSSRESHKPQAPTALASRKATRTVASSLVAVRPGVVREPSMHGRSLFGNREISSPTTGVARPRSALGRPSGLSRR